MRNLHWVFIKGPLIAAINRPSWRSYFFFFFEKISFIMQIQHKQKQNCLVNEDKKSKTEQSEENREKLIIVRPMKESYEAKSIRIQLD